MKKYATILSVSWQRAMAYRGVSVIFNSLFLINAFLNLAVWTVALKSSSYRGEIPFSTFIFYYIVLLLVHQLLQSYTGGEIANEHIKHGTLSVYLLKPFPYLVFRYLEELPWRFIQFLLSVPFALILFYFFRSSVTFHPEFVLTGFLIFPFAYTLSFLIQVFVAQFAFWFEDSFGFLNVIEILTLLFSGSGVAIFFLPPLLQRIGAILPFQYALYFPIATITNRLQLSEVTNNFLFLVVWLVFLGWMTTALWKKGLKKFTGEGI